MDYQNAAGLLVSGSTFKSIVGELISFINLLVGVLTVLALVIFMWGLVKYIYKSDDAHAKAEGKSSITWGLIALFVLVSIFGILQVLNVAFFGGTNTYGGTGETTDPSTSFYPGPGSTSAY